MSEHRITCANVEVLIDKNSTSVIRPLELTQVYGAGRSAVSLVFGDLFIAFALAGLSSEEAKESSRHNQGATFPIG